MKHAVFRPSIGRRLLLALMLACALLWGLVYLSGLRQTHQTGSGDFDRDMQGLATAIAATLEEEPAGATQAPDLRAFDHLLQAYREQKFTVEGYLTFHVWRADGTLVGRGRHASTARQPGLHEGFYATDDQGTPVRVFAIRTPRRGYRVEVTQTEASRRMQYDSVMLTPASLQILLMSLLVLWPLALLTVHLGLRPLRQLSRDLAQRQPDDLSPVDLPQVDRELAPVVQALNQTLTRLRSLLEHERNALADLAHELRTPLAVMTHQVDTLRHAGSESERSAAAQRLEGVLQRTTHLVHQMLALGRLDATTDMGWTEVRVPDLVRETLATHAPMAARRHMSLAYAGPDQMTCSAPGASLYLIVDNLVRNAISHGRDGMQVEVRLTPRANQAELPALGPDLCELSVLDNGPGVPAAQWPRLFERFYRLAPASTQGSGLGLAIVAAAAAQLGGHVHAHTGLHGQGLGVSVSWPMRP